MKKLFIISALCVAPAYASEFTQPPLYSSDSAVAVTEKPEQQPDRFLQLLDADDMPGLIAHARDAIRREDIYEAFGTLSIAAALDQTGDSACELARRLTNDARCALDLQRLKTFVCHNDRPVIKDLFTTYIRVAAARTNVDACEIQQKVLKEESLSFFKSDSVEDFARIMRTRKDRTPHMLVECAKNHTSGTKDFEPNILHALGFATYLCHAHAASHHGPQLFIDTCMSTHRHTFAQKYLAKAYGKYDFKERAASEQFDYPFWYSMTHSITYRRQIYERNKTAQTAFALADKIEKGEEQDDLIVESYNLDTSGPVKELALAILKRRQAAAARKEKEAQLELESPAQASSSSTNLLSGIFKRK